MISVFTCGCVSERVVENYYVYCRHIPMPTMNMNNVCFKMFVSATIFYVHDNEEK